MAVGRVSRGGRRHLACYTQAEVGPLKLDTTYTPGLRKTLGLLRLSRLRRLLDSPDSTGASGKPLPQESGSELFSF
jgi:hypothetical protein